MGSAEVLGQVPIYWWAIEAPGGTVTAAVNGQTEALTLPAAGTPLVGFGASSDTSAPVTPLGLIDAYPAAASTPIAALAAAILTHTEVSAVAARFVFDANAPTKGWPSGLVEATASGTTLTLTFSSEAVARFYGYPSVGPHLAAGDDGGIIYQLTGDAEGYWSPAQPLGQHTYRVRQRARYSLAQYGASHSSAQWGDIMHGLDVVHRDVQLARIWLAARLDPAYSTPSATDPANRNNLYDRMLEVMRAQRQIFLRRHTIGATTAPPQPATLRADVPAQLSSSDLSETQQGQAETIAIGWRWLSYPDG